VKAVNQLRRSKAYIVILVALAVGACAPLAQVQEVKPRLSAQRTSVPELQRAENAIAEGQKLERIDPHKAIGFYLSGLEATGIAIQKNRRDPLALRDYDFALSRVFSVIRNARLDPWTRSFRVPAPGGGQYVLTKAPTSSSLWKPEHYELIPADELEVRGKFVVPRVTRQGAGAALVAIRTTHAPEMRQRFLPPRIYTAVTAVAHFTGRRCTIEFVNPLANETINVAGRKVTSEADFTAPLAVGLAREQPQKFSVAATMDPDKFADKTGLIQVEPYDPDKIPVLLVHGLQSTPVSWTPMVNAFWADPAVRRNYQVWVFAYPSGYPVPYSAMLLRRQLELLDKLYPNHRPLVLVGHSMGGILVRLMISDSGGDKLWRYFFGKSPAETDLSPESKALLKEALIFKPRRDVARVIFISTPRRGSMLAQNSIGRLASSLIHKPVRFAAMSKEVFGAVTVQRTNPEVMKLNRMPTSIDTLSPNDAFVKAMNELPMGKGVPYDSIMGDRGRGDTPKSSDGVVPYWSSHLEGAASEKIVPSGHGANQNREAIADVVTILKASRPSHSSALTSR